MIRNFRHKQMPLSWFLSNTMYCTMRESTESFWPINFPALEYNHNLVTIFPRIIFIYENFDLDTTRQMRCKYNQIIPPHFSPLADIPGTLFVHNV